MAFGFIPGSSLPFPLASLPGMTHTDLAGSVGMFLGQTFLSPRIQSVAARSLDGGVAASEWDQVPRVLMLVKNGSGGTLSAKYLVKFGTGTNEYGRIITGYAATDGEEGFPVEESYRQAIPNGELFYITVQGPAVVKTIASAGARLVWTPGDRLIAGAGTGGTGGAQKVDFSGATEPLANQVVRFFGYALAACTTANTNTDKMVMIRSNFV